MHPESISTQLSILSYLLSISPCRFGSYSVASKEYDVNRGTGKTSSRGPINDVTKSSSAPL